MKTIRYWELQACSQANGEVYGHNRFRDGERITTSRIVIVSWEGDVPMVETESGSVYTLMDPMPDQLEALKRYAEQYL